MIGKNAGELAGEADNGGKEQRKAVEFRMKEELTIKLMRIQSIKWNHSLVPRPLWVVFDIKHRLSNINNKNKTNKPMIKCRYKNTNISSYALFVQNTLLSYQTVL